MSADQTPAAHRADRLRCCPREHCRHDHHDADADDDYADVDNGDCSHRRGHLGRRYHYCYAADPEAIFPMNATNNHLFYADTDAEPEWIVHHGQFSMALIV